MIVWHYTTGRNMIGIERSGMIRVSDVGLAPGERGAVWFSARETWEPSATKNAMNPVTGLHVTMTLDAMMRDCWGLFRIAVRREKTAPTSFARWRRMSGCPPLLCTHLDRVARDLGSNPVDWWVSFRDVPRALWLGIDMMIGDETWVPLIESAHTTISRRFDVEDDGTAKTPLARLALVP